MARKKKNNYANFKQETVEEFLARGGEIQKIPPAEPVKETINVKRTVTGPVNLMTLQEGALLFTEKVKRKKKDKNLDKNEVDYWSNQLPDNVKKKLGL